jgi:hypothetical protein
MCFNVILTNNFQYQSQHVDTKNITRRDQRVNVQITDKKMIYYSTWH